MAVAAGAATLEEIFTAARVRGFLYAQDLDSGREVAYHADEPVVLASVFKVAVLVELYRRAAAGDLDVTERIRVPASTRTVGPTGISVMRDDVELSLRDLAQLMLSVSDNTATDVLMARLGPDRIQAMAEQLGLAETDVRGTCEEILRIFAEDTGLTREQLSDPRYQFTAEDLARLEHNRSLDPSITRNRSTPRQWAKLLRAIWLDEAAPKEACAEMRAILKTQVWPHRLSSGFGDGFAIGAKTGTLIGIRNEAGVVEARDGGRYVVCVFTRSFDWLPSKQLQADLVIGTAGRTAVDELRAGR
jgi:beta-lactamase class A